MDENKIEITVELDTSKAEKQADDLNDALVDGAKDANKEFKKYSDSVNKNLNKIKQQVNKTFDGAKMANGLTSKVGKALNSIKSKINSILGNISINTKVDANVSSQGSTGASESGDMGTTLATTGMLGAMLTKSKDLGEKISKPLQQALDYAKSLNKLKIGEEQFNLKGITRNLGIFKSSLKDDASLKEYGKTFSSIITKMGKDVQQAQKEMNKAKISVDGLQTALTKTKDVFNGLFAIDSTGEAFLIDEEDYESFEKIRKIMDEVQNKIDRLKQNDIKFVNPAIVKDFVGVLNSLDKVTNGTMKYRMIALNAFNSVGQAVSKVASTIGSKLNSGAFGKAITSVKQFGTTMSKSFMDGFVNPNKYIDNMKAKINDWANKHKQATDKVKKANKSTGSSFKSLLQQMLPIASIYGAFNALKTSITSYADGLQQSGKFATVFGNETEDMADWLNKLNSTVTTSKSTLMDFSANLFNMGKNMKMPTDKAIEMSKTMTSLGADLEAFTGDANSIEALAGAMRGEFDSLQNFGFVLDAASVEARALAMGLDASSDSAKALATQSIILEQSKMAGIFGYSATQAQTLSGQLAMLRKNFQALGTAIGSCFAGLLQVVLPVLNSIIQAVTTAFNKLAGLINSVFGLFGIKVGASGASGGGVVGDAVGGIVDNLGSGLDGAGGDLADNLAGGAESAKEIAKGLMGIDEINSLSSPSDSGGGSGSGSSGAGGSGAGSLGGGDTLGWSKAGDSVLDSMTGELTEFQQAFLTVWERVKSGFILFKDDIISEFTKLKLNIDKLGQSMADFFKSCWQNGLDDTALIFGSLISRVTATALEITNSVVEVVTNFFNHLNPDSNPNTKKFIDSINNLLTQIVKFVRDAGKWFDQFATACQPFINNLGDIAMIVGGILADVLADAIELVRDFMNSWAGQKAIETIGKILEEVSDALETCLGFIKDHITFFEALGLGILGAVGAFKLINGAITIWNGLCTIFASIGAICSGVATVLGGAIAFLTSPIGLVVVAIGALIAIGVALYKNWDEVKAWCKKTWDAIVVIFNGVKDKITKVVTDIWKAFSDKFPNMANIVKSVFDNMKNIVSNQINIIKTVIKTVIDVIKAIFTGDFGAIKDIVKNAFNSIKGSVESIWNSIKALLQARLDAIKLLFSTIWNAISSTVKSVWNGISSYFSQVMNAIKNTINGVLNGIKTVFSGAWNVIKTGVSGTFNGIKNAISTVMNGIGTVISTVINTIKTVFSNGFNSAKNVVSTVFNAIKTTITNVMNTVKTSISNIVNAISSVFSNGFNNAKNTISTIFNAIKTTIGNILNGAKNTISTVLNAIKTVFSNGFNSAKNTVTNIFNAIKNTISNILNGAKSTISNIINGIKTVFSNGFNSAKNTVSNVFNGIKNAISSVLNGAKSSVSNIVSGISNSIKNGFNGAKNTVSSVFNSMKNSISSVMNSAKSTVSGAVSKIKSFFNFKWSLPKPKIPKFTAKWSTVFGVKIPTGFSISWHKKGGIFTQPTLLSNGRHGVGEAGAEAVLPLSEFYKKEDERFNRLARQLASNNNNGTTTVIVQLDGKEVARSTVKNMKQMSQLGQLDTSWL